MKKVAVLGAGLVGTPIAIDLFKDTSLDVKLVDNNKIKLERAKSMGIECICSNILEDKNLEQTVEDTDFVINALPGELGFQSLKRAIYAGKSGIDIAFYPEDFSELKNLAIEKKVCWVVDMGVAPGMSHLLAAYSVNQLDVTNYIKIYVGGLPKNTHSYWQYKAPFSPSDVLEEYTRPAKLVKDGKLIVEPALSEVELLDFPVVGSLEAFNSDGLRSLVKSLNVPNMVEKTLRYPGYVDKINVLKQSGFFSNEDIEIGGCKIKPLQLTSKLLFRQWELEKNEADFTIMQIRVGGLVDNKELEIIYDLYDEYCTATKIHSMARTTGYAATAALYELIEKRFWEPGVHPPEDMAHNPKIVLSILDRLKANGVVYTKSVLNTNV
jgi:lysine 6-dehydrogenase